MLALVGLAIIITWDVYYKYIIFFITMNNDYDKLFVC